MAPGFKYVHGLSGISPITDGKDSTITSLPASWYTSEEMFQLERRAIFTRKWMLITHRSRLNNAGEWVKFECAGYEFIISRDRKGLIHAFHNICRHRAYPLIEGAKGRSQIFSCRYHGWSYGLDGRLAKAPRYDGLEDFDKSQNSLFKIHTRIDVNGFVWVNLDSSNDPEPWEKDFANIDQQERYSSYNFDDYEFDHEWQLEGELNWKLACDNFNECYHCPTSHPTISALVDIETIKAESKYGYTIHTSEQTEQQKRDGLQICTTYYYPNVSTNILPHYIMLQRFVPHSAQKTTMHYQIFRNKNSSKELFNLINEMYKPIMAEDKALAAAVQKNLMRGLYVTGQMHPKVESAALHHQAKVRDDIRSQFEREKAANRQIWPAQQPTNPDMASKEDEEICSSLACEPVNQGLLAW